MEITSRSNPNIKLARALRQRKQRQASGLFLVEGIHHVGEAVAANAPIEFLIYAPGLLKSEYAGELVRQQSQKGVPCYAVSQEVFTSLAEKENPQGILGVVRKRVVNLEGLNPANFPWAVTLVEAQDPGNVGSILRTIDAVGASGLILIGNSVDPFHPAAARASMGTLFWLPIAYASFEEFIRWANRHKYTVYGASSRGELDYRTEKYNLPLVLLLGSEREGLSPEQAASCQRVVRLPMRGRASSLNLSVAAGVLLYTIFEAQPENGK